MAKKKQRKFITEIPVEFFDRLEHMFGPSVCRTLKKTFVERPTTFRVNTIKAESDETIIGLKKQGFKFKKVPWYADAYILENRTKRELSETSAYLEGHIYMQSLASMVPPLLLDLAPGESVFDMTAAPGSKTSQIAALMQTEGELLANDVNKVRFFKLKHNMEHLGVTSALHCEPEGRGNPLIVQDDEKIVASPLAPRNDIGSWKCTLRLEHGAALCDDYVGYFDKILLDAPCSAEARFIEGKPKTFGFWKERKIKEMAYKQRQLLFAAWKALKPGGTLVYSTCTFAPEENEVQISRLLERTPDAQIVPIQIEGLQSLPAVTVWKEKTLHEGVAHTLRILPTSEIEGFFVAKLMKKREE
jgi:16S rRNA (cytosine1407-C5)-methyltransferase